MVRCHTTNRVFVGRERKTAASLSHTHIQRERERERIKFATFITISHRSRTIIFTKDTTQVIGVHRLLCSSHQSRKEGIKQ
jgi:hypothetical protein